jgi:hypothetical protein
METLIPRAESDDFQKLLEVAFQKADPASEWR